MQLVQMTLESFSEALASHAPAPGGGSAAALCGALAAGLAAMVGRLTVGREKYRRSWAALETTTARGDELRARLLELVDADTRAYNQVMAAYRLPRETESQKADRSRAIQEAAQEAARIPLHTLRAAADCLGLVRTAIEYGNPNCITDAGTAAELIRAAAVGAAYNVRINLGGIRDKEFTARFDAETRDILDRVGREVDELAAEVESRL